MKTNTSPSTPDVDLKRVISNHFRTIVFPSIVQNGFIRLQRKIEFEGHRHRYSAVMHPPRFVETLDEIPTTFQEENSQILFETSSQSNIVK